VRLTATLTLAIFFSINSNTDLIFGMHVYRIKPHILRGNILRGQGHSSRSRGQIYRSIYTFLTLATTFDPEKIDIVI